MKSIILGAVTTIAIAACLTCTVNAKSTNHLPATVSAISDTGKMAKMDKMKTKKMAKKADKMSKSKMKMAKDSTGKM